MNTQEALAWVNAAETAIGGRPASGFDPGTNDAKKVAAKLRTAIEIVYKPGEELKGGSTNPFLDFLPMPVYIWFLGRYAAPKMAQWHR